MYITMEYPKKNMSIPVVYDLFLYIKIPGMHIQSPPIPEQIHGNPPKNTEKHRGNSATISMGKL